jgi:hypothetical protein
LRTLTSHSPWRQDRVFHKDRQGMTSPGFCLLPWKLDTTQAVLTSGEGETPAEMNQGLYSSCSSWELGERETEPPQLPDPTLMICSSPDSILMPSPAWSIWKQNHYLRLSECLPDKSVILPVLRGPAQPCHVPVPIPGLT